MSKTIKHKIHTLMYKLSWLLANKTHRIPTTLRKIHMYEYQSVLWKYYSLVGVKSKFEQKKTDKRTEAM